MTSFDMSPRRFDLLAELARFGAEHRVSLRDPDTLPVFTSSIRRTLDDALANPALLHGQRTEAMFEAMLISLGDFSVLKAEDQGRVYPRTGFRVPDFRVVLTDRTQWLIEACLSGLDPHPLGLDGETALPARTAARPGEPFHFENRPGVLRCRKCRQNTGLTVGTVMERSHTPLNVWFWAAYLVASQTPGMSAVQFQRQLGLSRYETAFQILHKLRSGMVRPQPRQDRWTAQEPC